MNNLSHVSVNCHCDIEIRILGRLTILVYKGRIMVQREVVSEESKEIKVPYDVLDSTDISKVAFAVNVQLTLYDARGEDSIKNPSQK